MRAFGVCWNKWFPSSPPERRVVFEGSSPFSSRITVTEEMTGPGNTMQRMLRFADGDVQSMITLPFDPLSLALPYMQGLAAAFELVPRRRSLLVVGLGGGSFPSFVRARYPDCDVECVELDPVVLRVATEHFYFREDVHCHVRIADGVTFVANAPRASLDCIVLDAYGPTGMPSNVTTPSFLAQCSRVLRDDGVMLANLFALHVNADYGRTVRAMMDTFPHCCIVHVGGSGNKIVVASRTSIALELADDQRLLRSSVQRITPQTFDERT